MLIVGVFAESVVKAVMTTRMAMLVAVLVWACFRHSPHDVMIDHPIGLQDFTVEVSGHCRAAGGGCGTELVVESSTSRACGAGRVSSNVCACGRAHHAGMGNREHHCGMGSRQHRAGMGSREHHRGCR